MCTNGNRSSWNEQIKISDLIKDPKGFTGDYFNLMTKANGIMERWFTIQTEILFTSTEYKAYAKPTDTEPGKMAKVAELKAAGKKVNEY